VAEYRMYLPLMAVIAGLVLGGERLLSLVRDAQARKGIAIVLVAGVGVALGVLTWMRNAEYATEITLWTRNLETRPEDAKAYMHLALTQEQLGDFDEAARLYETSIEKAYLHFLPEARQHWTSLLLLHGQFVKLGDPVFTIAPSVDEAYYLSILQADAGDPEGALLRVAAMEKRHPHLSPLKMLKSQLLAQMGRATEAETARAEALAIFPGYADWADAKTRWLQAPYFANPVGRRMAEAFAQQAALAAK
jgi:tetratricopeptide (TPR) repeat protein